MYDLMLQTISIVQEETGHTVGDNGSSTHLEPFNPQGEFVTYLSVVSFHCQLVLLTYRSTQCGQTLEDGERGNLGH